MNSSSSISCILPTNVDTIFQKTEFNLTGDQKVGEFMSASLSKSYVLSIAISTSYFSNRLALFDVGEIIALKKAMKSDDALGSSGFLLVKRTDSIHNSLFCFL